MGTLTIDPSDDSERRLREFFARSDTAGFRAESTAAAGAPAASATRPAADGPLDAPRLRAAVAQLFLLRDAAAPELEAARQLSEVDDDLGRVRDVAEALALDAPLPGSERLVYTAELMVVSDGSRPAGLVRGGRILAPEAMGAFGELYLGFVPDVDASIAATGRILADGSHVGTGVLVRMREGEPALLLTARHVVDTFGARRPTIDFLGEVGAAGASLFEVGAEFRRGKEPGRKADYCLLRLGPPLSDAAAPEPARTDLGDALDVTRDIAIVGYPGKPDLDTRALAPESAWSRVFEGLWHVKRVSPARLLPNPGGPLVRHDATTTGGSSGGPILSLGSGRVAAIHLGGTEDGDNEGLRVLEAARKPAR